MGAVALGDIPRSRSEVATMELKALILVGSPESAGVAPQSESIAGVPFACLDVLGATVLERIAQRLKSAGISQIALISAASADARIHIERAIHKAHLDTVSATGDDFWEASEQAFDQFRQNGADLVLLLKLGPYVELDYEEVIQHHIDKRCRMTSVLGPEGGSLGIFVLDSTRRGDAATLFRSGLQKVRDDCERFVATGYINLLQTAGDFRRLALDGLLEKNAVRPVGKELRPGVWVADGAQIHRKARVLAPAFIGAYSNIRAASLVTRNSVVEHHAEIDCGTVVENSTVLPYTYVGAGLDLMHSVVGFRRIFHLLRNVEVEVPDTRLVGITPASAVFRTVGSAAAFFAVLPKQIYRGFLGRARKIRPARLPESLEPPAATLGTPDVPEAASGQEVGEFPSSFAVVRRYGEH
jgi:NDP-sugar pyrophosphorylase family protein